MSTERLQKVLASAGIASRRDCEKLIASGRVMVNGRVVREVGIRVDVENDVVSVDGTPVKQPVEWTYIMLHKPVGVVSTVDDPHGRPTVVDLVNSSVRLFPVGRLDVTSEGLLLLTNDGELTYRLTHPSFEVEKEYHVLLDRVPTEQDLQRWSAGVMLDDEHTVPAQVEVLEHMGADGWVRVIMREGRKRQIREVARLLGYTVHRLIRVREGSLILGDLPSGQWRALQPAEVQALRSHTQEGKYEPRPQRRAKTGGVPQRDGHAAADEQKSAQRARRTPYPRRDEQGQFTSRPLSNGRYERISHQGRQTKRDERSHDNGAANRYGSRRYGHTSATPRGERWSSSGSSGRSHRLNQREAYSSYEHNSKRTDGSQSGRVRCVPDRAWRERQEEERLQKQQARTRAARPHQRPRVHPGRRTDRLGVSHQPRGEQDET